MKSRELRPAIPPLQSILQLLGKTSMDPLDGNVLLIGKFVENWLEKFGDLLPSKYKKELKELSNLLFSQKLEALEDENSKTLYSFAADNRGNDPLLKVLYRKGNQNHQAGQNDPISCVLECSTENMGNFRIVLSKEKKHYLCLFQGSDKNGCREIRKHLPDLRRQLENRGLDIPQIKVSPTVDSVDSDDSSVKKGLDLWG